MAFQVTVPPSVSAKMAKSLEETPQEEEGERTNRREDYKKVRTPFSQVPNIFAGSDHVVYYFSQKSWKRWERLELRLLWKTRRESEDVLSAQKTQSQARLHFNAHFISETSTHTSLSTSCRRHGTSVRLKPLCAISVLNRKNRRSSRVWLSGTRRASKRLANIYINIYNSQLCRVDNFINFRAQLQPNSERARAKTAEQWRTRRKIAWRFVNALSAIILFAFLWMRHFFV